MPGAPSVVVIGGTGFIGRWLVRLLAERGHAVRVVARQAGQSGYGLAGLSYIRGDVRVAQSIVEATKGASVVLHLASAVGASWPDFEQSIVQGSRNVAEACLRNGVSRLVYTSSIAALYLGKAKSICDDVGTDTKPFRRSYYSRAKIAAEKTLLEFHSSKGLPVVITRPGLVVGPGGVLNHSGVGQWPSDICCIGWGHGRVPLPFVLVQDVADALLLAMSTPNVEGMTFNLVGDIRLTAAEFVKIVAERSRRRFRFYPQSLLKLQLIEILKWMLKRVANKPDNLFPSFRDLKSRSLRSQFDCSAAKEILGWAPNDSLDIFIKEAIDSHIKAILPGDLRLVTPSVVG